MAKVKKELNMTEGPFLGKIVTFIIPLILTGLLQCLYNAADLAVVGMFRGEVALAAVGSTGSLTNLIVGLFMGLSVGGGVVVAHQLGAGERDRVGKTVHSSLLTGGVLGILVAIIGVLLAEPLLALMDTPETVLPHATLYLRIIFLGVPASMVYNYAAALVRSTGDTKNPLIFLSIAGVVNVALNLVFVAGFGMGVEGVAIATVVSQYLSAVMILIHMARSESAIRFSPRLLRLDGATVRRILAIGIPSGIQGCVFNFANVIIQSSVNSFGDTVMAGNSAASNLEGFVYIAMNAVYQGALTFVGQNVGAKRYGNIKRITLLCVSTVTVIGLVMGGVVLLFRQFFVGLYAPDNPSVLSFAVKRLWITLPFYFLCGIMDVLAGTLRGMGRSVTSMVNSIVGACAFRVIWVNVIFYFVPRDIGWVYWSWPISWVLVTAANLIFLVIFYRRLLHPKQKILDRLA